MMVWIATCVIWVSTLVFVGWTFQVTGSPWSYAILLLLSGLNVDGGETKKEKNLAEKEE